MLPVRLRPTIPGMRASRRESVGCAQQLALTIRSARGIWRLVRIIGRKVVSAIAPNSFCANEVVTTTSFCASEAETHAGVKAPLPPRGKAFRLGDYSLMLTSLSSEAMKGEDTGDEEEAPNVLGTWLH